MAKLNVAQVIKSTEAEGPGKRYAIWVQGCSLNCPGCCNPEMLPDIPKKYIKPEVLVEEAVKENVEGVSLLGGEPFQQPRAISLLVEMLKKNNLSVMLYTGYTLNELKEKDDRFIKNVLKYVDILVAGRYEREKRTTNVRWIGSTNQKVHFLTDKYKNDDRFNDDNTMEIRFKPQSRLVIVNGYPVSNSRKLNQKTKEKRK